MKKNWFQSKTIWGALIFAISSFFVQVGWIPESLATELVKWASGFVTIWGARDAMG